MSLGFKELFEMPSSLTNWNTEWKQIMQKILFGEKILKKFWQEKVAFNIRFARNLSRKGMENIGLIQTDGETGPLQWSMYFMNVEAPKYEFVRSHSS